MTSTRIFVLLAGAAIALADNTGTTNLAVGLSFSMDSGSIVTSGSDFTFTGATLTFQGSAKAFSVGAVGSSGYGLLTASTLPFLSYSSAAIGGLAANAVIAVQTNKGNYGKLLITAVSGSSITFQYQTFGNTTGGGGGGNVPTVTGVLNNYGQVPAGLPNYGIAPGSLFYVTGSALAGVTTDLQSSASPGLKTTLQGITVTVSVGGTTVDCPLYYLSPTQIDAVLPENTASGTGTIVVTNGSTKSAAFPIVVVQSAFGVLSYNGTLAATYDASNALITATNSANPGQTIVVYGSGIGANPKGDDKVFPQNTDNLTNIPTRAFVGGIEATVLFRGRTQFPGVDQINITIPQGVPVGCYVSLAIVSGSPAIVSNGTTIPIAASGKTCSEPNSPFSSTLLQTLSGQQTVRSGFLSVGQFIDIGAGKSNTVTNTLGGFFQSSSGTGFLTKAGLNSVSTGSCLVAVEASNFVVTTNFLDAGPNINVSGPQGSIGLTPLSIPGQTLKFYTASSVPANFIPAAGGPFTFDNGSGGTNVGHFNATTNFPANFNWTNPSVVTAIDRTQGATVTWSGGAPGVIVIISGSSSAQVNGQTVSGSFTCQAPLSAGQFTIPTPVLLALPVGAGTLSLADTTNPTIFTATGLDIGYATSTVLLSENVRYN